MSDPTKKSIVINKAFLSGSDNSGSSHAQNKKSKKIHETCQRKSLNRTS